MPEGEEEGIEAVRRKKAQAAYEQAQARQQQEEQVRQAIAALLEPDAYSRLMLVRQSNPALFSQAVQSIAYLKQAGQLRARLSDAQLRAVLAKISASTRREGSITFKRKGADEEI